MPAEGEWGSENEVCKVGLLTPSTLPIVEAAAFKLDKETANMINE